MSKPKKFAGLKRDGNAAPIPAANDFATSDATATPITSPVAFTATTPIVLTAPENAAEITIIATADLRVSEDPNLTHYDLFPANTRASIGIAARETVYLRGDTASGNAYFRFTLI
jgi:hypothetical protein